MKSSAAAYRYEKGATSVMVAVLIPIIIGFVGLGVDVGNMLMTQKRLQNNADAAALAAVSDIDNYAALVDSVIESGKLVDEDIKKVERGSWDEESRTFIVDPEGNSVRVELERTIDVYFLRILGASSTMPVNAVATADLRIAGVIAKLGASTLDIDTTQGTLLNALLGSLLGTTLNLSAVGWQGLIDAHLDLVKFLNLAKLDLGIGTTEGLMDAKLTVAEILDLMIRALQADGETAALNVAVLKNQILGLSVAPLDLQLRLGDVVSVDMNHGTLVKAEVDALSMIYVLAEVFNHKSAVSASADLNLGVIDADLKVNVVEPPVIRILQKGGTIHSAGARIYLDARVGTLLAGLLTNSSLLRVPLYLELGSGDAMLTDVSADGAEFSVGSSLARVFLGDVNENFFFSETTLDESDFDQARILDVSLLGLPLVNADAKSYIDASGGGSSVTVPPESFGETFVVHNQLGNGVGGLVNSLLGEGNLELDVNLLGLGLNLGQVTNNLLGQLSSAILSPLLSALLNPVSALTGVFPGRTDLTVYDYAYEAVLVE